jgi:hypothetical protein
MVKIRPFSLCTSSYAYISSFLLVGKAVKGIYDRFMPVTDEEAKEYFTELHEHKIASYSKVFQRSSN